MIGEVSWEPKRRRACISINLSLFSNIRVEVGIDLDPSTSTHGNLAESVFGITYLKGQCHKIVVSGFFHESSSPKPLIIPIESF